MSSPIDLFLKEKKRKSLRDHTNDELELILDNIERFPTVELGAIACEILRREGLKKYY